MTQHAKACVVRGARIAWFSRADVSLNPALTIAGDESGTQTHTTLAAATIRELCIACCKLASRPESAWLLPAPILRRHAHASCGLVMRCPAR